MTVLAQYDRWLLKCRPDLLHETHALDLKTCAGADTHSLAGAMARYGYDLQAAICWKACAILGHPLTAYYLVGIERGTEPLFNVRKIGQRTMQAAQDRLDALLLRVAECERDGRWLDYSGTELGEIEAPAWTMPDEMEQELTLNGQTHTL